MVEATRQELEKRYHADTEDLTMRTLKAAQINEDEYFGRILYDCLLYTSIRTGVTGSPLHRLDVATRDHQLVGGTGVAQTVKDDARELRVCVLPFEELLADKHRLHRQTVGEPQQHPAVAVPLRVEGFFPFQPFQPLLQLLSLIHI